MSQLNVVFSLLLPMSVVFKTCTSITIDCTSSTSICDSQTFTCDQSETICTIICGGFAGGSCKETTFIIDPFSDPSNIAQISCNTPLSCNGMKVYSKRDINIECNANSSCTNAYINVNISNEYNRINEPPKPTITIKEPHNSNFEFICSGHIGICTINCGISPTFPNGGVTLCSNGYFDCKLTQSSCVWNCIDTDYNYCYNNTLNCLASDNPELCYKENARNFEVNPIYSTSVNPTPEPTTDSISTIAPPFTTYIPTHPTFSHPYELRFTLILMSTDWRANDMYSNEGQQLFLQILNDTKITIDEYVFPINTETIYHIYPGHCVIYDAVDIYIDCGINSDDMNVIQILNGSLSNETIANGIDEGLNSLIKDYLDPASDASFINIGFERIQFVFPSIYIPLFSSTNMNEISSTNIPDGLSNTTDNATKNLMIYVLVSIASLCLIICVIGIYVYFRKNKRNTNEEVSEIEMNDQIVYNGPIMQNGIAKNYNRMRDSATYDIDHDKIHDIEPGSANVHIAMNVGSWDPNLMKRGVDVVANNVNAMLDNADAQSVASDPFSIPPIKAPEYQVTPGHVSDDDGDKSDIDVDNIDVDTFDVDTLVLQEINEGVTTGSF